MPAGCTSSQYAQDAHQRPTRACKEWRSRWASLWHMAFGAVRSRSAPRSESSTDGSRAVPRVCCCGAARAPAWLPAGSSSGRGCTRRCSASGPGSPTRCGCPAGRCWAIRGAALLCALRSGWPAGTSWSTGRSSRGRAPRAMSSTRSRPRWSGRGCVLTPIRAGPFRRVTRPRTSVSAGRNGPQNILFVIC